MYTSSLAIDFQQGLSSAWSSIATFVPKLVGFIIILLIGWIIAKVVSALVSRVLAKVGFDRLVERGGIKRALDRSDYDASDILAKVVYYAILLIALQMGFGTFGANPVSDMLNAIVGWLPKLFVALLIVVIAGAIAHAVNEMVGSMLGGLSYGATLGKIASVFIWGIGIIAALSQVGVAVSVTAPILITVLATIGGIMIVGVGGGLIRPMQQRWEGWLSGLEEEMPAVKGHAQAFQRGREDADREQLWREQHNRGGQAQPAQGRQWEDEGVVQGSGRYTQGGYQQGGSSRPEGGPSRPGGPTREGGTSGQRGEYPRPDFPQSGYPRSGDYPGFREPGDLR
ncbi:mechanosensitive ion channel family protein [Nocardia callitridis]